MPRWNVSELLNRLNRVLVLGEEILRELTGAAPDPSIFDSVQAFRWDATRGPGRLLAVARPAHFDLRDLVGVERGVERLIRNTEQFVRGLPYNHVLLYGERGTGKSSAIRGLLGRFADRGLRIVEVQKPDLSHLPRVLEALRSAGDRHSFVLFCDDLSFGQGEGGYRELKAALEGSIESPPANVCIVATSNRRHLLPESMAENRAVRVDEEGELHVGEALEEKLALSDRFGLTIGFYGFDQPTYLEIVDHYVRRAGLDVPAEQVREEALRWALQRASRSGRTARHYVDDLAGRLGLLES